MFLGDGFLLVLFKIYHQVLSEAGRQVFFCGCFFLPFNQPRGVLLVSKKDFCFPCHFGATWL